MDAPLRSLAEYVPVYLDDFEALAPALSPGVVLASAGTITSSPGEVIAGARSIRGSHSGGGSYTPYLRTRPDTIAFSASQAYRVSFRYRILTAPSAGFEVLFYSPTGASAGSFLPSVTITGVAGDAGTAELTNTLGPYADYEARWNIPGTGGISIDEIVITRVSTGQVLATENAEGQAPAPGPGIRTLNGASVVSSPALAGAASIELRNYGTLATNPSALRLSGDTTYVVEFRYRILDPGSDTAVLYLWLQPQGTTYPDPSISLTPLLRNAAVDGTFSSGALTAGATSWELNVSATADSRVIVDDIRVLRKDAAVLAAPPPSWDALSTLPFPRLGNYMLGTVVEAARFAQAEGVPLTYSVAQVESRVAMSDVIAGLSLRSQTLEPDSIRRIRELNPNAVLLPYRIAQEQQTNIAAPYGLGVDLDYSFFQDLADPWYARDTRGQYVPDPVWPIRKMNISPHCPVVGGHTYGTFLLDWLAERVFSSGVWDGIFFDNLFARINPHILDYDDPALLDYDWNRNGRRDETPALSSEMTAGSAGQLLQELHGASGGLQLVMGNAGSIPEPRLAPHVNGYLFECFNHAYDATYQPENSPQLWRAVLSTYRDMQDRVRRPALSILQACGGKPAPEPEPRLEPTPADVRSHRFALGTALLGDGFYEYDLYDSRSAPYWFDELSVDATGTAAESRESKGYLGLALSTASELTEGGADVFHEDFEAGVLPSTVQGWPPSAVSVTTQAHEVIAGNGSLTIGNPDHRRAAVQGADVTVDLPAGSHLVSFDWRILESLDGYIQMTAYDSGSRILGSLPMWWHVGAGERGTVEFPLVLTSPETVRLSLGVHGGGGKVAIDNVRVTEGRAGPWRRDFERGFVLVNPLPQPHTFSPSDLAGGLGRTGIRRIRGTQAPDVNNGLPVTGSLTLDPFDAIVLLADAAPTPVVSSRDAWVNEGTGGSTAAALAVTLSRASGQTVRVSWATVDATAQSGGDYQGDSGTLMFAPGETRRTIGLTIAADSIPEASEAFRVVLSGAEGATLASSTGTLTILDDDDPAETVSIADASVVEGSGGTRDIQFAVTLSSAVAHPVSVAWETASGTALAGQDFAWSSGTVTFPPGVTSRTVTVTIVGDGTPEPDESFRVVLGGTAGVVLGDASAEGRIVNDDASGGPVRRRLRRGL
jgi:hypothetical protein